MNLIPFNIYFGDSFIYIVGGPVNTSYVQKVELAASVNILNPFFFQMELMLN